MKHALIVGGGPVQLQQLKSELAIKPDLIIAADRGGLYFSALNRWPDFLIGDFDSLPENILPGFEAQGVSIQRVPPAKDQTDLELAVDLALTRGMDKINILGGLGQRIDHTLGNIGLLYKCLQQRVEAHLLDVDHDIWLIQEAITLQRRPGWSISLIPFTACALGVTTTGLAFPLNNEALYLQNTRGIHNEFSDDLARIQLSQGILLVTCFRENL